MDDARNRQMAMVGRRSLQMLVSWVDRHEGDDLSEHPETFAGTVRLSCLMVIAWIEGNYHLRGNAEHRLKSIKITLDNDLSA